VLSIGVDATLPVSDAEYVYAPIVGLKAAVQATKAGEKVLLIFDDVLLHQFKERFVYGLAL